MKLPIPALLLSLLAFEALAEANAQNYPELTMVPRATERLGIEATRSEQNTWGNHLPLHVAGASTLLAGIMSSSDLKSDNNDVGPKVAMAVGAGWLATSIWLQTSYRPYKSALLEVKRIPGQNLRSQLASERLAEEHIDQAAGLAKKIKWISFATNAGASVAALSAAKKDSAAQGAGFVGVAASLLPVLFPLSYEKVGADHHSYKKKVFGPLTFTNGLLISPDTQRPTLGLLVGASFN